MYSLRTCHTWGVCSYRSGRSRTGQVEVSVIRATLAPPSVTQSTLLAVLSSMLSFIESVKTMSRLETLHLANTRRFFFYCVQHERRSLTDKIHPEKTLSCSSPELAEYPYLYMLLFYSYLRGWLTGWSIIV